MKQFIMASVAAALVFAISDRVSALRNLYY